MEKYLSFVTIDVWTLIFTWANLLILLLLMKKFLFKLNNLSYGYTLTYYMINGILFIIMIVFLRKKIFVATIINLLLTGVFSDIFNWIFIFIGFQSNLLIIRVLFSVLAVLCMSFGVAMYAGADLGIAPYDAVPLIMQKAFPKVSYKFFRISLDLSFALISFIVGFLILKIESLLGLNTVICFICLGPLITFFSNLLNKIYYKNEEAGLK